MNKSRTQLFLLFFSIVFFSTLMHQWNIKAIEFFFSHLFLPFWLTIMPFSAISMNNMIHYSLCWREQSSIPITVPNEILWRKKRFYSQISWHLKLVWNECKFFVCLISERRMFLFHFWSSIKQIKSSFIIKRPTLFIL